MPNILDEILAHKLIEVAELRASMSLADLQERAKPIQGRFLEVLKAEGINLITEIKPKSPSGGVLRADLNLEEVIKDYCRYATAISVLTDKRYFDGSFELLEQVSQQAGLPLLCKDFVIDDYQCYLARAKGAEAVLLIVKILSDERLTHLNTLISSLGMTTVVEIQNADEAKRAIALGADCILINNRDLDTLEIDMETTLRIAPLLPSNAVVISASGITERRQIDQFSSVCHNFLIGSSLMLSQDIGAKLAVLKGAPKVEKAIG